MMRSVFEARCSTAFVYHKASKSIQEASGMLIFQTSNRKLNESYVVTSSPFFIQAHRHVENQAE